MGYGPEAIARAKLVIEHVTAGIGLEPAAKLVGISLVTLHEVFSGVRELAISYARAREIRADVLVDEAIAAADNPDLDPQRARNMMTIRQWIASKHNSRVYGERIDLNVSQSISIGSVLSEARARAVLPVCYQADTLDMQVIDVPTISVDNATDTISEGPGPDDIFS